MGEETARLKEEIERTREDLTRDVDRLAEKTSPARIVERRVQRTRGRLVGMKEKIMGTPETRSSGTSGTAWWGPGATGARTGTSTGTQVGQAAREGFSSARDAAREGVSSAREGVSHAGDRAQEAVHESVTTVRERAEGNPLAAGVVAFGVGWLVSSLMPASEAETQAAQRAGETVREHAGPIVEEAKQAAGQVGEGLKGPAQEAADQVRSTAEDAAQTVREEARSSVSS